MSLAGIECLCEFGPHNAGAIEPGIAVALSTRLKTWFDLGLGLRYDLGFDSAVDREMVHFVSLPLLAMFVLRASGDSETRTGIGAGPALGLFDNWAGDDQTLVTVGPSFEIIVVDHRVTVRRRSGVLVALGARADLLKAQNAPAHLQSATVGHAQAFLRLGVGWR
jgi:hypothetical protein